MKLISICRRTAVALMLAGLTVMPLSASAYTDVFAFGDSLTDTGNASSLFGGLVPLPPYAPGRFSDGDIWIETFGSLMGMTITNSNSGGTNYAYGGARTGPLNQLPLSLLDQTAAFMADYGNTADSDALYVVWGGGNDVRDDVTGDTIANLTAIITDLAAAGATDFLVPNLPDIGRTPESLAGDRDAVLMTALTLQHNSDLAAAVESLRTSLSINIIEFDVFGIFNEILADPAVFGFSNVTDPCYEGPIGLGGPEPVCADPSTYLFFDGIHPTAAAHEQLGILAYDLVAAPIPVPAALPLLLSALAVFGVVRRRA